MVDLGFLLTFPVESIAIRAVLASVAGVLLVRLLLRVGLRTPSVRVATALAPAAALVLVLLASRGRFELPALMLPADAIDALPVPVRDGYLRFAPPMAWSLLVGVWALVAGTRLARRGRSLLHARRAARAALAEGAAPPALTALTARLAGTLKVTSPKVAVVPTCPGGASVVGTRRPVVVVGEDLLEQLDPEELEGVLAHELAHVRRRDNLVAAALGALRDLTFFVPGGGWAVRQLHAERERAADQVAASATGRPGALASGLLKVLDRSTAAHPCAAFAPSASLVERIEALVEERPSIGRLRRSSEVAAVASVTGVAALLALVLPSVLAGPERQRDAVALVWSATPAANSEAVQSLAEARAFDVWRRTALAPDAGPASSTPDHDEGSTVDHRAALRACTDATACPVRERRPGLGMLPRPVITVDTELPQRWRVGDALVSAGDGALLPQVFWLQRVR